MYYVRKWFSKCDVLSAGVVCKKHEVNQFQNMQVTHQFPSTPWVTWKISRVRDCRLQVALYSVSFYPIQIDLVHHVQDLSLSVGIFGIWRRLFGTCFNSFSPVPNDKLDFASTVWTQPLTSSCFIWFLLGSFRIPENHKTHVTGSKATQCNVE